MLQKLHLAIKQCLRPSPPPFSPQLILRVLPFSCSVINILWEWGPRKTITDGKRSLVGFFWFCFYHFGGSIYLFLWGFILCVCVAS